MVRGHVECLRSQAEYAERLLRYLGLARGYYARADWVNWTAALCRGRAPDLKMEYRGRHCRESASLTWRMQLIGWGW